MDSPLILAFPRWGKESPSPPPGGIGTIGFSVAADLRMAATPSRRQVAPWGAKPVTSPVGSSLPTGEPAGHRGRVSGFSSATSTGIELCSDGVVRRPGVGVPGQGKLDPNGIGSFSPDRW